MELENAFKKHREHTQTQVVRHQEGLGLWVSARTAKRATPRKEFRCGMEIL